MIKPQMIENLEYFKCMCMKDSAVTHLILDYQCPQEERLICEQCYTEKKQYVLKMKIDEFKIYLDNQQRNKLATFVTYVQKQKNIIESIQQRLQTIKQNFMEKIDQFFNITFEWIQSLENQKTNEAQYSFLQEIEQFIENQKVPKKTNYEPQHQTQIKDLNTFYVNSVQSQLNQLQVICEYTDIKRYLRDIDDNTKKEWNLNLERISSMKLQQATVSFAMTFNKNNSLLLMSLGSLIKVFNFNRGEVKLIQTLSHILRNVTSLNIFENESLFLSTSHDSFLRLESLNLLQRPKYLQKLKGHMDGVLCCKINPQNTVIISGSLDKTIKFWSQSSNSSWQCFQTIKELNGAVYDLSINPEGNQVISCGFSNFVLVIEQKELNNWMVKQIIQVNQIGSKLTYISNNKFVFQPSISQILEFYTLNKETGEYSITQELQQSQIIFVSQGASRQPIIYNFNKNFIMNQVGEVLNFIKLNDNTKQLNYYQAHLDQFNDTYIQGTLNNEGAILATWTKKSSCLTIWRCSF
ncbi:unnamed protein product [Paramecium primaurelia]|uniref:WD domain, G-beta repeat protein n=1 Tax=Paramecium primaurelia TaxID=5886 RepID=A0A8S1QMD0_PARPR|nr:unnamed protein product [Paramecium primaurelia]